MSSARLLMTIFSWGSNSFGQLSLGFSSEQEAEPAQVNFTANSIVDVNGGGNHSILVTNRGIGYTVGCNDEGQGGLENSLDHLNFALLDSAIKVSKISCGWNFNACILENGKVLGWGSNSFKQLGFDDLKIVQEPRLLDVPLCIDVSCGLRHLLLVTSDGCVIGSGSNRKCQLGGPSEKKRLFRKVNKLENIKAVKSGENHSVALSNSHIVYSWGDNKFGQTGKSHFDYKLVLEPAIVSIELSREEKITEIHCGWSNSAVLTDNGTVYTWGRNDYGQLGEQHRNLTWLPSPVKYQLKFSNIALGSQHTIALTYCKRIISWGWNEHGSCGDGTLENKLTPTYVKLPSEFRPKGVGSGAAHSFVWGKKKMCDKVEIDVKDNIPNDKFSNNVDVISGDDSNFNFFFHNYLVQNRPCIVKNIDSSWPCFKAWASWDSKIDLEYICNKYDAHIHVAQCDKNIYDVHEKIEMSLANYLKYWNNYHHGLDSRCLYLKDWHFMRDFPDSAIYRVPMFFASDWLGEYYDCHPELKDDYRFVYIGPKGSWTPLHMDVFSSYSWSINVIGRKRWLLLEPGIEEHFKDKHGNLFFDQNLDAPYDLPGVYELQQDSGDAIFVPSGWHHQEDTISINHNWVNGSNIFWMWKALQDNLGKVKIEIKDCKDMDNWDGQCQLMLKSLFGINFNEFYYFLAEIVNHRIESLNNQQPLTVFGDWKLGFNYLRYDLEAAVKVLKEFKDHPDFNEAEVEIETPKHLYSRLKEFMKIVDVGLLHF